MSGLITRRNFVAGLAVALAAPAIVKYEWIMPVRSLKPAVIPPPQPEIVLGYYAFSEVSVPDALKRGWWRVRRLYMKDGNVEIYREFTPYDPRLGEPYPYVLDKWTETLST